MEIYVQGNLSVPRLLLEVLSTLRSRRVSGARVSVVVVDGVQIWRTLAGHAYCTIFFFTPNSLPVCVCFSRFIILFLPLSHLTSLTSPFTHFFLPLSSSSIFERDNLYISQFYHTLLYIRRAGINHYVQHILFFIYLKQFSNCENLSYFMSR